MSFSLKRLFSSLFWLKLFHTFLVMFKRFPLVIVALIAIVFVVFNRTHGFKLLSRQSLFYIYVFAQGGAFWFTATTLLKESLNWGKYKHYLFALPLFFIYCWYAFSFTQREVVIPLLILFSGLCISFSAWQFREDDNHSFWYFNYQLISAICFALLSAVILCGGVNLIIASTGYLFEIKIPRQVYFDFWMFGMIFLAPVYFLANIPTQFDYQRSECRFPKGVNFILTYVLVPLTLIYMVILYAYFIKIIVQWTLPHGHLGKMISFFGIIGIITHLAIYPIHDRSSCVVSWFYRYFYLILIVPVVLLAIAIGQRIMQYGITETRYIVVICTLWFSILIVCFFKKRQQTHLINVPLSLAGLCLICSFGPWGIYQLPVNNQFSRLELLLNKNQLLVNGKISVKEQIDFNTRKSISSMVDYLNNHCAIEKIRPWFNNKQVFDTLTKQKKDMFYGNPASGQKIVELMGFEYVSRWIFKSSVKTINNRFKQLSFAVTGFDVFIPVNWMSSHSKNNTISVIQETSEGQKIELILTLNKQGKLILSGLEGEKLTFDLLELSDQLADSRLTEPKKQQVDKMILEQSNEKIQGKLYITGFNRALLEDETIQINNLSANLILKIKKTVIISK